MSPRHTFLDGPYRPRPTPHSGVFHPVTKVVFTTALVGIISGIAAVVVLF